MTQTRHNSAGRYANLFEPLAIGGCTISNRIVRSAHSTGVGTGPELIRYHTERAKGGSALAILQIAGVHPESPTGIAVYDDRVLPFFEDIASQMHDAGSMVFQQLWHGGAANRRGSSQPIAPSPVPNPTLGIVPREMTQGDIDEIVAAFAAAARRCEQGGLDGIELHGAHGYLICQFLSPATNHRNDDYGGSTENRARFLREILAAIRSEVSAGYPVGVRFSASDEIAGGIDPTEAAEIARLVEPDVDFIDVSLSSYWRFHKLLSTLDDPLGYELPTSEIVTKAVEVPTIVTGRIMTLDHASHLVETGVADMVSMVRAMIADPQLVVKARDGREAEIRPCIGTSMGCVAGLMATGKLQCVVNAVAGNETRIPLDPPRAGVAKRVLIAGGGPAGLEAARTAALRGHDVVLCEMTSELGGQVRMAAAAPHRSDLGAITGFLADEMNRLGVDVRMHTPVEPDLIADIAPAELIIATGTTPRRGGFQISAPSVPVPGADLPHVYTSWDVLGFGGRAAVGSRAVVFDDTGTFEAISVADALIAAGAEVTFVSRLEQLGARIGYPPATVEASRERLFAGPFTFVGAMALGGITADTVTAWSQGTHQEQAFDADTVVIVTYHDLNNDLADYLRAEMPDAPWGMHLIGDVNGTSSIQAAVHSGNDLARQI